jgi:uncharacterized membrane protein YecN with MAPEG domain
VDDLSSVPGIVALGAAGVGVLALLLALVLAFKLRRLRRAQAVVLGEEQRDLVGHAARLESGFTELRDWVEEALGALGGALREVPAPLLALALVLWLTTALVTAETPRFRAPLDPFLLIAAALGVVALSRAAAPRRAAAGAAAR